MSALSYIIVIVFIVMFVIALTHDNNDSKDDWR
jgi:hypothetical protein